MLDLFIYCIPYMMRYQLLAKTGHICFGTRATAAKCWNLDAIFTPKKRSQFSIIQTDFWKKIWNLETICNNAPDVFFRNQSVFKFDIPGFKVGQKTQNWTGKLFFCKTWMDFVEKNDSQSPGRDGKICGFSTPATAAKCWNLGAIFT